MLEPKMGPEEPEAHGRPWHGSSRARQTWGVLGQVLVVPTRVGQDGHGDMRGHPAHPAPPAPQDGQLATTTPPQDTATPMGTPRVSSLWGTFVTVVVPGVPHSPGELLPPP